MWGKTRFKPAFFAWIRFNSTPRFSVFLLLGGSLDSNVDLCHSRLGLSNTWKNTLIGLAKKLRCISPQWASGEKTCTSCILLLAVTYTLWTELGVQWCALNGDRRANKLEWDYFSCQAPNCNLPRNSEPHGGFYKSAEHYCSPIISCITVLALEIAES